MHLFDHTIWWVVPLTLAVLAGFGVYERLWTYVGQRDFEQVGKGAFVATLLVVGVIALVHPYTTVGTHGAERSAAGQRRVLFLLLMSGAARGRPLPHASGVRGPDPQHPRAQGHA